MPAKTKFTAISEPTLNLTSGAPDALKWIAEQEHEARTHFEKTVINLRKAERDTLTKPMEKDGTDWVHVENVARGQMEAARDEVQKWQKMLLAYDTKIQPERRDATEKITREEGERMLTLLAIHMREGTEQLITTVCQEVLSAQNERDVYRIVCTKLRDAMRGAVDSAWREGHLPAWCKAAMDEVYPMAYPAEK